MSKFTAFQNWIIYSWRVVIGATLLIAAVLTVVITNGSHNAKYMFGDVGNNRHGSGGIQVDNSPNQGAISVDGSGSPSSPAAGASSETGSTGSQQLANGGTQSSNANIYQQQIQQDQAKEAECQNLLTQATSASLYATNTYTQTILNVSSQALNDYKSGNSYLIPSLNSYVDTENSEEQSEFSTLAGLLNSLSQEGCSTLSSYFHPSTLPPITVSNFSTWPN